MITKCDICGGNIKKCYSLDFKSIVGMADDYTHEIGLCTKCQSIFTINPFDEEKLANRYKNNSKFEFDDDEYFLSEKEDYKIRCERQRAFIDRTVGLNNIHSILEIGASSGYNLSLYNDEISVYGIEPSQKNCRNAKNNYGVDMFCGVFDEYYLDDRQEKYDLVFMSHTLEHIVNPCTFMKKCATLNSKYVFIEVPDINYKCVDEPFGIVCEEHVNIFTLQSLENLMFECGYELINADMVMYFELSLPAGIPAIASIWVKKSEIKRHRFVLDSEQLLNAYLSTSEKEMERINDLIDSIRDEEKIAIWGTGHHASMLMANTRLGSKNIVRVYDSDTRKQGIKFEGIEIQAFDELDIIEGKVDTILIASYTAQKAIINAISASSVDVNVIKLYDL